MPVFQGVWGIPALFTTMKYGLLEATVGEPEVEIQ